MRQKTTVKCSTCQKRKRSLFKDNLCRSCYESHLYSIDPKLLLEFRNESYRQNVERSRLRSFNYRTNALTKLLDAANSLI